MIGVIQMPDEIKIDSPLGVSEVKDADIKDDVDFLTSTEEEKEIEVKPPKDRGSVSEEETEDKEKETKEEESKEEVEGESETPEFLTSRPTWSEINKKYPEFFKDFPQMRHVIGREMEYSKIFPTIDDAKDASEKSEDYQFLEDTFNKGESKDLLGLMKDSSSDSYNRFVKSFLPTLYKEDQNQYLDIITPVIHGLLYDVYKAAGDKDENLRNAALVLSEHLFNDMNVVTKPAQSPRVQESKSEDEHQKFMRERLVSTRNEVESETLSSIHEEIYSAIAKQFPDEKIPSNLDSIIVDIVESGTTKIDRSMMADEAYMKTINSLWKRAYNSGFTGDWKERIISAYLSRAKELIPGIAKKVSPFIPRDLKTHEKRLPSSGGKGGRTSESTPDSKEIDWNKTSDRDFLEGNIKTK